MAVGVYEAVWLFVAFDFPTLTKDDRRRASRFRNDLTAVDNKDAALTVLIHLGYLAYDRENEQCYIPNYEIRQELNNGVLDLKCEVSMLSCLIFSLYIKLSFFN